MMPNDQYRNDYVAFINEILDMGYTEKVPEESVATDPGKVWYIPHHGVYHRKKAWEDNTYNTYTTITLTFTLYNMPADFTT